MSNNSVMGPGFFIFFQTEDPITNPGTGGGGGYAVKRTYEEKPDYEKLKRERLIAQAREEDEIAVAVITLLLTTEFFE